jgi:hypothetical protein
MMRSLEITAHILGIRLNSGVRPAGGQAGAGTVLQLWYPKSPLGSYTDMGSVCRASLTVVSLDMSQCNECCVK